MNITQFIEALEKIRAEHGDLMVAEYTRDEVLWAAEPTVIQTGAYDHGDFPIGQKVVIASHL